MKKNSMLNIAALFIGIFGVGIVLIFIIFISKGYYHADCTDTITWAEAIIDGNSLMNQEFYYACLLPFGGQLLMLPFVAVFGVGMTAQICGMVLFALVFAAALVFLCRSMDLSYKWSCVTLTSVLMVFSISEKLREIFWCHIIYYSLGLLFLMVGLGLVLRIIKSENPKKRYYIFLCIWTVLCSMNGIQSLTIYGLPVVAALIAEIFFDLKTPFICEKNYKKYILILSLVICVMTGFILSVFVNGDIVAGYQDGYSTFSDQKTWMDNFLSIIPQLFTLFGVKVSLDVLIYSFDGILALLKIICALVIITIPVIMTCMYKRFEEVSYRLMILTHVFMTALILLGWIFGSLNTACWRLSPVVGTSVILCVMFMRWIYRNKSYRRISAIIAVPIMIMILLSVNDIVKLDKQTEANRQLQELTQLLEDNDLEYGYATFWNANSITLLSDSKVKVRCTRIDNGKIYPRMYQTNINWYKDNSYDKYFILLTGNEYYEYLYGDSFVNPERVITYEDFFILVYSYNIMEIK